VTLPLWFKVVTLGVLTVFLLVDLTVIARRPRSPSMRESALWVGCYVGLAVMFAGVLWLVSGSAATGSFVAGWLTEYSLSVDNLFVFMLIMNQFAVPRGNQQTVLMLGIIVSLLLRGGFILAGAAALSRFSWIFYLFGAFLVYTAVTLVRGGRMGQSDGEWGNALLRRVSRAQRISDRYHGVRLTTRRGGRRMLTPMVVVLLAIGTTDLLFAFDSIPAIFGLTQEPFIVFTATLFALMGLRQLYFLLGGLLDRLVYLSVGLAVILAFIGVKLVLEALHGNELPFLNGGDPLDAVPTIPIGASLGFIVLVLAVTTVASLARSRRDPAEDPPRHARDTSPAAWPLTHSRAVGDGCTSGAPERHVAGTRTSGAPEHPDDDAQAPGTPERPVRTAHRRS
jgi:tellurite resistance protein TerC